MCLTMNYTEDARQMKFDEYKRYIRLKNLIDKKVSKCSKVIFRRFYTKH